MNSLQLSKESSEPFVNVNMDTSSNLGPFLEVIRHTSLHDEKVTRYGQTYTAHVIVKHSPFVVTLALRQSKVTFANLTFDLQLIYDMPGFDKLVPFVASKPFEYKSTISETGQEISFDVRINVLSSHHEDNYFRLQITLWGDDKVQFPSITHVTDPIKVISKPSKPRSRKPSSAASVSAPQPIKPRTTPKRKATEMDDDYFHSDEDKMDSPTQSSCCNSNVGSPEDFRRQLDLIINQQKETIDLLKYQQGPSKKIKVDESRGEFESAFTFALHRYTSMTPEEKAERMRRVLNSFNGDQLQSLEELFDVLATAGVNVPAASFTQEGHSENCADNCNHKSDIVKLDHYYSEVFF